jgi:hypothetical protein
MTCTLDCVHFAEVLAEAYMIYVSVQLVDLRFQLTLLPLSVRSLAFNHRGVSSLDFPEVLLKIFAAPLQQTVMYKPSPPARSGGRPRMVASLSSQTFSRVLFRALSPLKAVRVGARISPAFHPVFQNR